MIATRIQAYRDSKQQAWRTKEEELRREIKLALTPEFMDELELEMHRVHLGTVGAEERPFAIFTFEGTTYGFLLHDRSVFFVRCIDGPPYIYASGNSFRGNLSVVDKLFRGATTNQEVIVRSIAEYKKPEIPKEEETTSKKYWLEPPQLQS